MVITEQQAERLVRMFSRVVFLTCDEKWRFPNMYREYVANGVSKFLELYPYDGEPSARIVDYVVYQIYRYRSLIGDPSKRFQVTWCFSDNAIDKYRMQFMSEEGKHGITHYIDEWLGAHGLDRNRLIEIMEPPKANPMKKFINPEFENPVKARFHNTDVGYMLCQRSTTGWTPMSKHCSSCKFNGKCMEATRRKYPELYRLRLEKT